MKKKPVFKIEELGVEKVDDSDLKSVHGAGPGCDGCDMCSSSCCCCDCSSGGGSGGGSSSCDGCDMCSVIAR